MREVPKMTEHADHHVVPKKIYYTIFGALMLMTAITVGVAYIDLGPINTIVAIVIACIKAMIVVLYFMHVKFGTRLVKLTVIAGLYWMGILLTLTLSDYLTRGWGTYGQQLR
jgi:cytochrome c oxidase subunit IV